MVDSHVLVGSCAQIGARVHLSAGVTIGGVLEPAGARPVIVEDGAFVGAGIVAARGRAGGGGRGDRGRRDPHRDLAPLRPRARARAHRHARGAARRPAGRRGGARVAYPRRRVRRGQRPVRRRSRCWSRTATPARTPGSPWRTRCDEPVREPAAPDGDPARRGRLGGRTDPRTALGRTRLRDAVLRLRPGRRHAPGRGAPGRPAGRPSTSPTRSRPTPTSPSCGTSPGWASVRTSRPAASCGTSCGPGSPRTASCSPAPASATRSCAAAVEAGVRVVTVESPGELRRLARDRGGARPPPAGPAARRRLGGRAASSGSGIVGDDGAGQVRDGPRGPARRGGRGGRVALARAARAPRLRRVQRDRRGGRSPGTSRRPWRPRSTLAAAAGFALRLVDAGGGLGIPYERRRADRSTCGRLGARLAARRRPARGVGRPPATARVLLEPGRFLVGRVRRLRRARRRPQAVGGHHVVILDGGIHHVLRPGRSSARSTASRSLTGSAAAAAARRRAGASRSRSRVRCAPGSTSSPGRAVMAAARARRPRRGPRRRRLRRDGVDAVLPVAPAPARGRAPRRRGVARAPARRPGHVARLAGRGAAGLTRTAEPRRRPARAVVQVAAGRDLRLYSPLV